MKTEIRPVHTPAELMKFIKFPWQIYRNDPYWVPPLLIDRKKLLDTGKNPFFKENPVRFFMAYRNSKPVGRIAAIINHRHNEYHQDKAGFFGFLEGINDREVFELLLNTACEWLRQHDRTSIVGPVNPSTNDEVGFLVDGFDTPPFFMMTHSPAYYNEILESLGYRKAKDLLAYFVDDETVILNKKMQRVCAAIRSKYDVAIRPVNLKNFKQELEIVRSIYNDAWAPNWGFVPMTPEEFDFVANDFRQIINPELALIGEYKGEAVGFLLALPNYNEVFKKIPNGRLIPFGLFTFLLNKNKIRSMRVVTLGIKRQYQAMGIGALFYDEIIRRGRKIGMQSAEMSWILEDNDLMNKAVNLLGARPYKTYRIYEKDLVG